MIFKINDIVVDFKATFGNNFGLVNVEEKRKYVDGARTDETYFVNTIVCFDKRLRTFQIKTDKQFVSAPQEGDIVGVALVGAVAKPYVMNNQLGFTVTVDDIKVIKE